MEDDIDRAYAVPARTADAGPTTTLGATVPQTNDYEDTKTLEGRPTYSSTSVSSDSKSKHTPKGEGKDKAVGDHDHSPTSKEKHRTGAEGIAHQKLTLDTGETRLKIREHWWQIWRSKHEPPPPPASLDDAKVIPLASANIIGMLSYSWLTPIMHLGYQRTLQATDLWKLDERHTSAVLSAKLDAAWARRCAAADEYNARLTAGEIKPSLWTKSKWAMNPRGGNTMEKEKRWREKDGRKEPSLAWSLNEVFGFEFWSAGLFKVFGDTAQLMAPLVIRAIINYGKDHNDENGHHGGDMGRGVAMAFGLFLLTFTASLCQHQFFWRSMTTGVLARAALIASLYKRGVNLTAKARTGIPNAALVNHISTDVSRIDAAAQWFHAGWTAPVQVILCLIILCVQLGPAALAGFALFAAVMPLQERIMRAQFVLRRGSMIWTDKRAKLLVEVLSSMRVVKYFTYELPFLKRIFDIRRSELRGIRKIQFLRSSNLALAFAVPILAATIGFVVYSVTEPAFDPAIIFSSLSLFVLLRQPLMLLPRALAAIADSKNAFERLAKVFKAPVMEDEAFSVDPNLDVALKVEGATWEWEETMAEKEKREAAAAAAAKKKGKGGGKVEDSKAEEKGKGKVNDDQQHNETPDKAEKPFSVANVSLTIQKGSLVAIVGPVGCGKSSLLQGLIGEMRRVSGNVAFGGRVAYCPQTAWISNNTLRENILFGAEYDEDRYWDAVEKSCLLPDLELLADGDLTEIGERGINLSGGQKQRVNIARALYFDADVVIFDDPLSAVDAHVGKALFADAIIGALRNRGKAVILVTHALHFLSQCDYIYTLGYGHITEQGTYDELVAAKGEFARLDKEFGGAAAQEETKQEEAEEGEGVDHDAVIEVARADLEKIKGESRRRAGAGTGKLEGRLIVSEKRTTGSVGWKVYLEYLKAARGAITGPLLLLMLVLMQGSIAMNSYALVWWQTDTFKRPQSFYQIIYGSLGISQAIWTFFVGVVMDIMSFLVSENLHHNATTNMFHAPMSFFDTTPMGRILGVFGKDIDTIDDQLAVSMRMFAIMIANAVGAVILITVIEHYFIVAAIVIGIGYNYFAGFYRASAREIKRLDSMLRSLLYGHFSESLTGLPTIRSYGGINRFIAENAYYIDLENRALFLSVTNQRWLAVRLDFMGAWLIFVVAMLSVAGVSGVNPAQMGVVLAYTTQLTQMFSIITRQSAEVENYMNSVERVVHYSRGDLIEQEAPHEKPDVRPPKEWPSQGAIKIQDVRMSYRKDLPDVLRGISVDIKGGEKIGVVGRTGAGKSSLMLALFRIVELKSGSITIDDIDISSLGLRDLRSKISIIPQDPLLFSGTIRSNLDPFNLYDDVQLWDALRRSYLVEDSPQPVKSDAVEGSSGSATPRSRFTLESVVESEGANLSQGERSLLSIARALVKDSKVVILDEATASVDLATDSKIQDTIQAEFFDRTLLCIAHRLRTILAYDRILVLDAGTVAEFDTPTNLFGQRGIFWNLCERSKITLEEIQKATVRL